MKKIGILELHYHSIFFYTLARVCKTKNTQVTLFTTRKIFSLVEPHLRNKQEYTIILKEENESINTYLKKVETICNESIDILFLNTIQESLYDLPHYVRFKPRCKMILTIHNTNSWLHQTHMFHIKNPVRTFDTILSSIIINKKILPRCSGINIVYPPIKDYIRNNTSFSKDIYTVPFTFYDNEKPPAVKKDGRTISIVVPGAIEQSRRDYQIIVDVFQNLFPQFSNDIALYLLGRPVGKYGHKIIELFKQMNHEKNFAIHLFEEYVPEETYDHVLSESDLILSPISLKAKGIGVIEEIYGLTKGISSPFEAIQYAKPLIVPSSFTIIPDLQSSTIQYDSASDLEQTLKNLLMNRAKLTLLTNEAALNSRKFTLPILQKYFENNILKRN